MELPKEERSSLSSGKTVEMEIIMKKAIIFLLVLCMIVSVVVLPATAEEAVDGMVADLDFNTFETADLKSYNLSNGVLVNLQRSGDWLPSNAEIVEDDGVTHITHQPKGPSRDWVSDPRCSLPQSVTVRLPEPRDASEVRVVFDSDFFLPRIWVHHRVPTTLARSYKVETSSDGIEWEPLADVARNVRRLAVHRFASRKVLALRVTVRETYGDESARIFEIGLW